MKTVAVYCASSTQILQKYFDAAHEVGELLAKKGIRIVTGAGNLGLMNTVENSALEAGGTVVGVIPEFMIRENWHHTGLSELIVTADMHSRKQTIADLSNGCIALPGGCGTMEELLEVITWKQLGLYLNPIVILNLDGFYDPLLAQLQRAVEEHFMRDLHANIWCVASTPAEAVELVLNTPQWDSRIRRFAAI